MVSSVSTVPLLRVPMLEGSKTLIERAQAGDELAFRQLFEENRERVRRIVFRVLGQTNEADDIVQDVFIHVFRSISSFRGDAKFSTWLYRLAVNVARMHIRRKRSRPRFADLTPPEAIAPAIGAPDVQAETGARVEALRRLIDQLSEKKRLVLVLHDLEGLPAKEIAEIVEAPVLTVRTRLFYARKELYAALAKEPSLAALMRELMPRVAPSAGAAEEEPR